MTRLLSILSLGTLVGCATTTPVATVGVAMGPNGVRVVPSVGVTGPNATLVFHP